MLKTLPLMLALGAPAFAQEFHCTQQDVDVPGSCDWSYFTLAADGERALVGEGGGQAGIAVAHVFARQGLAWLPEAELVPGGAQPTVLFGSTVALDGDRAVVADAHFEQGGAQRGRLHIFDRDPLTGSWTESQRVVGPALVNGHLGRGLALDGDRIAASAPGADEVVVLDRDAESGVWAISARITYPAAVSPPGWSVDLEGDVLYAHNLAAAGAQGRGYVYRRAADGTWALEQVLAPPTPQVEGQFGRGQLSGGALFISAADGAQADDSGRVYVYGFDVPTSSWLLEQELSPYDVAPVGTDLGYVHFSVSQETLVVSQPEWTAPGGPLRQGRLVVYRRDDQGVWSPAQLLTRGAGVFHEHFGQLHALGHDTLVTSTQFLHECPPLWIADLDDTDCDADGTADACQLAAGEPDLNGNGVLDECEVVGGSYCGPAVANSTGFPAQLTALGSLVPGQALDLCASALPTGAFGYLLGSALQGFVVMPGGSSGNLCLGGGPTFGRFTDQVQAADAAGRACVVVDLTAVPTAGQPVTLAPGDTWNFQYWYRDGLTSNHTPGVEVVVE